MWRYCFKTLKNRYYDYNVDVEKTKILILSKNPITKRHFYFNESIIENVK